MTTLLTIAFLFLQSTSGVQGDLKAQIAQQVQRIKTISGESESFFFELPATFRADGPVVQLTGYGMEAIPLLTPYLDDTSFTQAYRAHGSGRKKQVVVNEYIVFVISKIANHNFYLPSNSDGTAADFAPLQNQVLSWWKENRDKTLLQRKIIDVNDPEHPNRFAAYEWLGHSRSKEGRPVLEQRIEMLLNEEVNSLKQTEMVACAKALGEIGDNRSSATIKKVCDHLSYWFGMSYGHGRSGLWSGQIPELFKAHRALAAVNLKVEALARLRELATKYLNGMDEAARKEFLRNLEEAERW